MNFNNFDHSPALLHLASEYELALQRGETAFYDEETFLQLIDYYAEETTVERALGVADEAIVCHDFSASLYLRKAALLIQLQEAEKALDVLEYATVLSPNSANIQLLRAEALIALEEHPEALLILEELRTHADTDKLSQVYVTEALLYEKLELYDRMFYSLEAALSENPSNQQALEKLWLCVELSKKYKESIRLHERILDDNPYAHIAWYNLAHSYSYFGRYTEAIEAYEYAYLIDERFEFAYRDCAELCFETKAYQQALDCYEDLLEHFPPDGDIYLRMGQCQQHFGNLQKARNYYVQAILLDPLNDEVFFHIGQCYAATQQWKKAIRFYEKATTIEDGREEYFAGLAEAYQQVGQHEQAAHYHRQA
ncbi:MAG: tetratricopeptide repeat protein, partial [Bacteroidota bacterium]